MTSLRPLKTLKIGTNLELTAPLEDILKVMFDNHAFPADEGSAHKIEREFYVEDRQPITVTLGNYQQTESFWQV